VIQSWRSGRTKLDLKTRLSFECLLKLECQFRFLTYCSGSHFPTRGTGPWPLTGEQTLAGSRDGGYPVEEPEMSSQEEVGSERNLDYRPTDE
jgi:hypothetical protein